MATAKPKPQAQQAQAADLQSQLMRSRADYQNLEKRVSAERENFVKFANSTLLGNLIPSLEILEKASFHSQDIGVKMALDIFRQALLNEGLEQIDPEVGNPFDHDLCECIETRETKDQPDGTVAEVVSKGYRFKDGPVLKPAKVKVYKSLPENKI